jgi:predicted nucleic acid-binding protein
MVRGFQLVSRNRKHFAMIGDLRLESPLYEA